MATILDWLLSKDDVKVEFYSSMNYKMIRRLSITMDICIGPTALCKGGCMYHPITMFRSIQNVGPDNEGFNEEEIVDFLEETYQEGLNIFKQLQS